VGPNPGWQGKLRQIRDLVQGAGVLVGEGDRQVWSDRSTGALFDLFAERGRLIVPVLLGGSELPEGAPPSLQGRTAVLLEDREGLDRIVGLVLAMKRRAEAGLVANRLLPGEPFVEPATGIRFLWIPGGRFRMGSEKYDREKPVHWVRLNDFWIGETPVTNAQYQKFMVATGQPEPALWRDRRFSDPDQPVVGVDWNEAMAFCRWLTSVAPLSVTLPSEAQWEYAARGTDGREYPWEKEEPDQTRACFGQDWNSGRPATVGSYPLGRGPFGTLDQAGNVWEWCLDVWDDKAYAKRAKTELVDPVVTEGDKNGRSIRGGSWFLPAVYLRSACRHRDHVFLRSGPLGFRLAAGPASRT
jgi:serine/threonine-protein kinase